MPLTRYVNHQPTFTCNNKATPHYNDTNYIQINRKIEMSLCRFLDDLQDVDIIKINRNNISDASKNYDTFIEIVLSTRANHLTSRKAKFNRREHRIRKWVTTRNIKSTNTKDKMFKMLLQSRCHGDSYKTQFNKYIMILRKTTKIKRIYYLDIFC